MKYRGTQMFEDIKNSSDWQSVDKVSKGWSSDSKYFIKTKEGKMLLLRISDMEQYETKKKEYEIVEKYSKLGFLMSQPIDFGICNNGKNVYMLLTWIEGKDLEEVLSDLTEEQQYQLGRQAGKILKKIHSIDVDINDIPKDTKKSKKLQQLSRYEESHVRIDGDEIAIKYVKENIDLIWKEKPVYMHGDYHPGNLIYTDNGLIGVIDFNRWEVGDPYEEFYKLESFGIENSIPYCIGQIDAYFDELPEETKNDIITIPNEVQQLIRDLQVELITTERLKRIYRDDEYRRMEFVQKFAVEECSEELRNNVKNILSEYANTSQKLDEQFPSKILKAIKQHEQFSGVVLKDNIQRIDELRKKHVKAGVLEENNDKFLDINVNPESLDDSTAAILTVYYQDMKIKLDSLNSISDRIVLFKNMMANKFGANKEISISKDNGIIVLQKPSNKNVELRFLSSGEQQELVLLYKLIFKGEKEKIILIDEPEISLNVSWQREFLDDMKKIVEMNGFSILIATHSPQIINDNWDLVESLGDCE